MSDSNIKSVEQVLTEPSPSTMNYRSSTAKRKELKELIDSNRQQQPSKSRIPSAANLLSGGTNGKLTWFNGVFIPVLLNIWGVIMFLRLGWVVGQAGLLLGTVIVIGANVVTGLTALSLCAICTNGEVQGGGVYFLISRALGPVYGGTIGILFFIAQAVAVSLYVVGFAEALIDLMQEQFLDDYFTGSQENDTRVIGLVTATLLFLMSLIGIGWYAKTQTILLFVLVVAIMSVYLGAFFPSIPSASTNRENGFFGFDGEFRNVEPNFQVDPELPQVSQGFFTVFAVFFPAVTGIMAGANLSGDLEDASKAIPKGTLRAIAVTFVSYLLLLWLIGLTCLACVDPNATSLNGTSFTNFECSFDKLVSANLNTPGFDVPEFGLLYDKLIMKNVSLFAPLVYIGIFAATLSSALASLVGAPRVLQSVANDQLFPFRAVTYFGVGRGANNEPVRGYCLTFVIACGCVLIGKLDLIAPIITNFFMVSYALTNYACFASSNSEAPNWRPSFKYFNKHLSLFGAVLCVVVMFLIDWIPSLVTILFALGIFFYLKNLNFEVNWGEAGEAKKYTQALQGLETLQLSEKEHVKTFRPQMLVLTGDLFSRIWLVKFVSFFQAGGGFTLCGDVLNPTLYSDLEKDSSIASDDTNATKESTSVLELFNKENSKSPGSSPPGITTMESEEELEKGRDTAKDLAKEFELVQNKRSEAYAFLNQSSVWGQKRCKGVFYEAVTSTSLLSGFQKLLQLGGIGKLRPNTVVIGFKSDYMQRPLEEVADYERMLRAALSVNLGCLVVRDDNFKFEINLEQNPYSFLHPAFQKGLIKARSDSDARSSLGQAEEGSAMNEKLLADEFHHEFSNDESALKRRETDAGPQNWQTGGSKSAQEFKERIEKYKANDLDYMSKFERQLPSEVPGEHIDVWWLADDGGLTMLLPQLLVQNPMFKGKKLRVMAGTSKYQSVEETQRLKKAELRMVHLLHKFRIDAETVGVDLNFDQALNTETKERFERCMGMPMSELNDTERQKTLHNLRLAEEIRKTSRKACMVFMILPIPETSLRVKLHTTWLDMVSHDMPPMIMMRGNNKNVLTFFC